MRDVSAYGRASGLVMSVAVLAVTLMLGKAQAGQRVWTFQDSMAMKYVALEPDSPVGFNAGATGNARPILASPDGEYFLFLVIGGDLQNDAGVNRLVVYRTQSVLQWLEQPGVSVVPPAPLSATFRSRVGLMPLEDPRWNVGGRAVTFKAISDAGNQEAYRLNIQDGTIEQLSRLQSSRNSIYWFATRGAGTMYAEVEPGHPPEAKYPAVWADRTEDGGVKQLGDYRYENRRTTLFATYQGGAPRAVSLRGQVGYENMIWLNPDGTLAIAQIEQSKAKASAGQSSYVLIDMRNASAVSLSAVPGGRQYAETKRAMPASKVYWSHDGQRAIFVNVTLRRQVGREASEEAIVEYEVLSGRWKVLELLNEAGGGTSRYVTNAGWLSAGTDLLVTHETNDGRSSGTRYSFTNAGITAQAADASIDIPKPRAGLAGGLEVELRQDPNTPPTIVASKGALEKVLLDLNPQLNKVRVQRTEEVSWLEADGQQSKGALTLPAGYPDAKPFPLVIHAYFYEPTLFLPDGHGRATEAAQTLAARGIAVLTLNIPLGVPDEGPLFARRIDAAVEHLAKQGIVDPKRVGATGFSRAGYNVLYAVTHPGRVPLAAAMGADFFTGSYGEYLQYGVNAPLISRSNYDRLIGGSFWKAKEKWLQYETTFNADRSVTPLLMTRHGNDPDNAVQIREDPDPVRAILGSFALNDKPLDYLYFGYSSHPLSRPRERIASQEAMVDWMAFWLQGYEDPSPEKAYQYRRWRPLRTQQSRSLQHSQAASGTK